MFYIYIHMCYYRSYYLYKLILVLSTLYHFILELFFYFYFVMIQKSVSASLDFKVELLIKLTTIKVLFEDYQRQIDV